MGDMADMFLEQVEDMEHRQPADKPERELQTIENELKKMPEFLVCPSTGRKFIVVQWTPRCLLHANPIELSATVEIVQTNRDLSSM